MVQKVLSQEEAITKLVSTHGNRYDYSLVEYTRSSSKIKIICKEHGEFSQTFNSHSQGHGCPKCSAVSGGRLLAFSEDCFITKSKEVHGEDTYDYSLVHYTTALKNVKIICKIHGEFSQRPAHHLNGHGCSKCSTEKNTDNLRLGNDKFVQCANEVHGFKYDYSRSVYRDSYTKLEVICKEHGSWLTSPVNHIKGSGCPLCPQYSGYRAYKAGVFYILACDDLIKIGVTNNNLHQRLYSISSGYGKDFNVVKCYEVDCGRTVLDLETVMLKEMRALYKQPLFKFDGYTECFYDVNLPWLLNIVESKLKEINEKEIKK